MKNLIKIFALSILLFCIGTVVSAQNSNWYYLVHPLPTHVTSDATLEKSFIRSADTIQVGSHGFFVPRFAANFTGIKYNWSVAGNKPVQSTFNRAGVGINFLHETVSGSVLKNNWSAGLFLLYPTVNIPEQNFMSLMGQVAAPEIFNYFSVNVGLGVDLINNKKLPVTQEKPLFKEKIFICTGLTANFNLEK